MKKVKYRSGHYIVTNNETYHIVKKAMNRSSNTWAIYRQTNEENGDGFLYDYNGNYIWVSFGVGGWIDSVFDNSYRTLNNALEVLESNLI